MNGEKRREMVPGGGMESDLREKAKSKQEAVSAAMVQGKAGRLWVGAAGARGSRPQKGRLRASAAGRTHADLGKQSAQGQWGRKMGWSGGTGDGTNHRRADPSPRRLQRHPLRGKRKCIWMEKVPERGARLSQRRGLQCL